MTLREFMDENDLSLRDAAEFFGLSSGHVSDLASGKVWPRREVARILRDGSNGRISLDHMLAQVD